jgi:hypothetical protein
MKMAGLSVDVDSVASHLEGYGFDRPQDDGTAMRLAVPRAMDLFERYEARATFFLIGCEAESYPDAVREIADRGHEVASHSMTHRLPFATLDNERAQEEIIDSKELLLRLSGEEVVGFRAPSWDADTTLCERLARAGYSYDASAYPSILLPLLRRSIASRSETGSVRTTSGLWDGVFGPTRVHRMSTPGGPLWEIPVSTTPGARLPYYHTLRFVLPRSAFKAIGAWARSRRGPVTYQFHAVDFLDTEEDGLDPRIARHPGMKLALSAKLALAEDSMRTLGRTRRIVPLKEIIDTVDGAPIPVA